MLRRSVLGVIALLLMAALLPGARADISYESSEVKFPSEDGTMLHADVFRPSGVKGKTPVILIVSPYRILASPTGNPALLYPELENVGRASARGYTIVQVSPRGYGESEGCGDFGGPGEQMDAKAAVEWSASQEWSSGKVGMYGLSYDAWTQVMALANRAKGLTTAIVGSPLISAYRGLFMNGIHYASSWHATPGAYAGIDAASVGLPNADSPACYANNAVGTAVDDPTVDYWKERDLIKRASKADVPVFWTHGFLDANTKPDNWLDVYTPLPQPKRAWFGQFPHTTADSPSVGHEGFMEQAMAWFDHHLRGLPLPKVAPVEVQQGDNGFWRAEETWPPSDASFVEMPFKDGLYADDYLDDDGSAPDRGTWTFSQELPYDIHLAGEPIAKVLIDAPSSPVHVHVRLFDVKGTTATLITRGAALARGEALGSPITEQRLSFQLYPQDWVLRKGHHLGILLSGADNDWFDPGVTGTEVTIRGGVRVPFLRFERTNFIDTDKAADNNGTLGLNAQIVEERTLRMPLPPRLTPR